MCKRKNRESGSDVNKIKSNIERRIKVIDKKIEFMTQEMIKERKKVADLSSDKMVATCVSFGYSYDIKRYAERQHEYTGTIINLREEKKMLESFLTDS